MKKAVFATLVALFAFPGAAPAAGLLSTTLTEAESVKRTCHASLVAGNAGVAKRSVVAPATGLIQARLSGPRRGDWDLGVFDADGRAVAGSAHFRNRELAEGIVVKGQRLTIQACRRSGPTRRVRLKVESIRLEPAVGADKVQLVRVFTPTDTAKSRLVATGLDLTEHGGADYVDVVLHGADDVAKLNSYGFGHVVLIDDLVAHDRKSARAASKAGQNPSMPSGRHNYRRLPDYAADMKLLADEHPGLVRKITLPFLTRLGRPVEGIEITKDVNARDGKPVFLQMGVHHAREWPSGEHAIEWAFELVNNYGESARTTRLVSETRTIVVPIVNPDGFNLTREVPFANQTLDPVASSVPVDLGQSIVDQGFGYKRRNCHIIQLNSTRNAYEQRPGACSDRTNRNYGVDPNRNYGGSWGGPGATYDPTSDLFYGEAPFSEPETQNVRWIVSHHQVTTLITNHTYSDLILRPPGIRARGDTIDEHQYKAFGAEMADQNGYSNWQGYQLYDTTGTTEDWSYFATGGFGFTFEIGRAAQSLTNDVNTNESNSDLAIDLAGSYAGVGFHPPYPLGVVSEWHGKGPWAGKGNREAYYVAQEATLDESKHSVLEGTAVPGTLLRLSKSFQTATSPQSPNADGLSVYDPEGQPILFTDTLETEMVVPPSGTFEWHVNPSTRPDVLRGTPGRDPAGPTSPSQTFQHDPSSPFVPGGGAPIPASYEERDFTIAEGTDNGRLDLLVEWPPGENDVFGAEDLDVHLYRKNAFGLYEEIAKAATAGGPEHLTVIDPPPGDYRIRVENWYAEHEASKNWTAKLDFSPPTPAVPGTREAWSLTCIEPDGDVFTGSVVVDRGERAQVSCSAGEGKQGPPGPPGPPGNDGADGTDGKDGAPGSGGKDGASGSDGARGADGRDGADGRNGADGQSGTQGPPGAQGPAGPIGPRTSPRPAEPDTTADDGKRAKKKRDECVRKAKKIKNAKKRKAAVKRCQRNYRRSLRPAA